MCQDFCSCRQDLDRHELVHIPFYIHCPAPGCAWHGNRPSEFWKHWEQKGHRSYYNYTPGQSEIETYNPKLILDQIRKGTISLPKGQEDAVLLVQIKSYELGKPDMLTHPWGKNRRRQDDI